MKAKKASIGLSVGQLSRYVIAALSLISAAGAIAADSYPVKPVRIIVPFAPGGTADITGRVISAQLTEQTGKSFLVENLTGAGGIVGHSVVTKAAPDGYTMSIAEPSLMILPSINKSLPFDITRDFTPVSQIIAVPLALVISPTVKAANLEQFISIARQNKGAFNYGSAGVGTLTMLAAELFKRAAKVDLTHVPYKGSGDVMTALMGGQIQMTISTVPTVVPFVNSGKLQALAVTTSGARAQALPNVPSMSEAGLSDMAVFGWFGLVGPGKMPKAVLDSVNAQIVKAAITPSVRKQFAAAGGEVVGSNPEEFAALYASEIRRWSEVTKAAGIVPE